MTKYDNNFKKYFTEKCTKNFFVYDNGNLKRYKLENNKLMVKDYIYIHLQKRKMKINVNDFNSYKIIPNSFESINTKINSVDDFKKIKAKNFNLHYFKIRFKNLKNKIKIKMEGK